MIAIFHSDGIELSQAWAIQEKIDSYMAFYRSIHGNVFPKCHFLEDHVVDWIERWGFWQGGEAMHHVFTKLLARASHMILDEENHLFSVMKDHMVSTHPEFK